MSDAAVDTPRIAILCDRCLAATDGTDEHPPIESLKLRGARLLVDKVAAIGSTQDHKVSEHIYAPANHERVRRTYGIEARIVAVGPACDATLAPGDRIIIDEFGGRPLWWGTCVLPYWIIGEDEIMIVLAPDSRVETL